MKSNKTWNERPRNCFTATYCSRVKWQYQEEQKQRSTTRICLGPDELQPGWSPQCSSTPWGTLFHASPTTSPPPPLLVGIVLGQFCSNARHDGLRRGSSWIRLGWMCNNPVMGFHSDILSSFLPSIQLCKGGVTKGWWASSTHGTDPPQKVA